MLFGSWPSSLSHLPVFKSKRVCCEGGGALKHKGNNLKNRLKNFYKNFPALCANASGSASVISLFWAFLFVMMVAFLLQLQKLTEWEVKNRAKTYLCFKKQVFKQFRLIKRVVKLNRAIKTGRLLMLTPKTYAAGKAMIKGAQTTQSLLNKRYFLPTKGCPLGLFRSPFGVKIKRGTMGLARFKEKVWKIVIKRKWSLYPFQLEAHFRLPHRMATYPVLKYRERKSAPIGAAFWWRR